MFPLLLLACTTGGPAKPPDTAPDAPPVDSAAADSDSPPPTDSDSDPPDTATEPPCDTAATWYVDADGDGVGTDAVTTDCAPGSAPATGDCDDTHASVVPGGPERATSGRDDNCDGVFSGVYVTDVRTRAFMETGVGGFAADVALPGDLDGDGSSDLLIMDNSTVSVTGSGAAFIYFGPLSPSTKPEDPSTAGAVLTGAEWDGVTAAGPLGDVDGDGFVDMVLSGPRSAVGPSDGVAYLVRGPVSPGDAALLDVADVFYGLADGAGLGSSAGPIDMDGDGLGDLVLGADDSGDRQGGYGDVYILRGPVPQSTVADADTTLHGQGSWENLGLVTRSVGDVNGDGLGDLGLGANMNGEETSLYLVLEAPPGTYAPGDVGVRIYTHAWGYTIPEAVGDVDGDGLADLGVGVPGGYTLPILLSPLGATATLDLPDAAAITLTSTNSGYDYNDLNVTTPLGDWDGDGHDDFAAANPGFGPPDRASSCIATVECPGAVFFVAGPLRPGVIDLETQTDWIAGEWWAPNDFGTRLAGGSDLDGDGAPELVIGEANSGLAYVLFGGGVE